MDLCKYSIYTKFDCNNSDIFDFIQLKTIYIQINKIKTNITSPIFSSFQIVIPLL